MEGLFRLENGPLLFIIYINDLDKNVQDIVNKFSCDTTIGDIIQ